MLSSHNHLSILIPLSSSKKNNQRRRKISLSQSNLLHNPMRSTAKSSKHSTQTQNQNHAHCLNIQNPRKLVSNLVFWKLLLSISSTTAHEVYNLSQGSVDEGVALKKQSVGNGSNNNRVDEDDEHGEVAPSKETG